MNTGCFTKFKRILGSGWWKQGKTPEHARFLRRIRLRRFFIVSLQLGIFLGLLGLWELAVRVGWIDAFIASSPSLIWKTTMNLFSGGELGRHIAATLKETVIGFTLGTLLGTLIAVVLWWSKFISEVCEPYLVILNSIPKVALGPIFIVWLGTTQLSIIVMALAVSIMVTVIMVYNGFQEVDLNKVKLLQTFGATRSQILTKVTLPASVPTILAALKVNLGLSLVGTIVGEFLVSKEGLGYLIVYGGQVFNMSLVMAGVAILCITAYLLYIFVTQLERIIVRWK